MAGVLEIVVPSIQAVRAGLSPGEIPRVIRIGLARRLTFDEMLSVGRLDLISDLEVREAISHYYWLHEDTEARIESRRTRLPGFSYELSREDANAAVAGSAAYTGDRDLLAAAVASGELHRAATAEVALSGYHSRILSDSHRRET